MENVFNALDNEFNRSMNMFQQQLSFSAQLSMPGANQDSSTKQYKLVFTHECRYAEIHFSENKFAT